MQLIVFEDAALENLLPLTYSRATFNLRCGFDNLLAKIETAVGRTAECVFVRPNLAAVMAERQTRRVNQPSAGEDQLWINGRLLVRRGLDLPENRAVWSGDTLLAARLLRPAAYKLRPEVLLDSARLRETLADVPAAELPQDAARLMRYPWDLIAENEAELIRQAALHPSKISGQVYPGAHLVNESAIHLGAGAKVKPSAVLDAESGPIRIEKDVVIHSNTTILGPCYIGEGCVIQPGARIRGNSSIGMVCKIGGEVEGTIFHGYSNKQHDGFLGHSYVGEWVNLGANTVNSDLKNTYGPVRVPINGRTVDSGLTFVGGFIGDHTKTGINTALPTGCVIGYASNVFVSRYAPRFVPSFTWLTDDGAQPNDPARALAVARTVVSRRGRNLSAEEESLFLSVYEEARRREAP